MPIRFFSSIHLGLSDIVYFKVATIILSTDIEYVCGYKEAIKKIHSCIYLPKSSSTVINIASLGENEIPETTTMSASGDSFFVEDGDDSADNEKYFTALIV